MVAKSSRILVVIGLGLERPSDLFAFGFRVTGSRVQCAQFLSCKLK